MNRNQLLQKPNFTVTSPILPFTLLILPIAKRFRFHFETRRETNRRDKVCLFLHFLLLLFFLDLKSI